MKPNDPSKVYNTYLDEDELNNQFTIIDNLDIEDDGVEDILDYENDIENISDDENCVNCFYSDGSYCSCKDIYINRLTTVCWCYRDCFNMRTNSDFQDDCDDFD